jgi:hypothetical protein
MFCDMFLSHVPEIDRYQFYDTENFPKATIGTTFTVCARLWGLLELHCNIREIFVQPKHILWALCFLKVYASQYVLASLLHVDRKTLMWWIWIVVENIHDFRNMRRACANKAESEEVNREKRPRSTTSSTDSMLQAFKRPFGF